MNIVVKRFYEQWKDAAGWTTKYLNWLNDEELAFEVAPGRNHGIWILGHLIQSEDDLARYLGRGDCQFPEYEKLFSMKSKLLPISEYPPAAVLREHWLTALKRNDAILQTMTDEEWDQPHSFMNSTSEDDFYGTKGSCIFHWTMHMMYHNGQLAILLANCGKAKY